MAERSFPLENTLYTAEEASLWFATRTSGVHASNSLGVSAGGGMTVMVGTGVAWLKYADYAGVAYANTETKSLTIPTANGSYPRIDRVVLRYSKSENRVYLAVRAGTPASVPAAPAIVRDSSTHEISLAQVYVGANATSISNSNITDERLNNTVCGLMSDGVTPYVGDGSANGGYDVGDIYITTKSTSPAEKYGGEWEQIKDRFLLAAGESYMAGSTGGEATHTLTMAEMPAHEGHLWSNSQPYDVGEALGTYLPQSVMGTDGTVGRGWMNRATEIYPAAFTKGSGNAHNNMPPYLAVYVWRRVA